jgi:HD superfamily phosphohydrolase
MNYNTNYTIFEDPLYGYMKFDSLCMQFINTIEFQRLRYLRQLGPLSYIYNSANHTRLEHSLGVSYLSYNLINKFKIEQPELIISNKDIKLIQLSGLLHDIGHGPYSHIFDGEFIPYIYPTINYKHEIMSLKIIDYMIDINYIDIEQSDINSIKNYIINNNKNSDFKYQIVANYTNSIDVDKFDYLVRDIYYLSGYSKINDFTKILKYNRIIDNTICYNSKMSLDIYNLFQQRYNMHKQYYNHKIGKAIEYMIRDILIESNNYFKISDSINNIYNFLNFTDDIINTIKLTNENSLTKAKNIINRIETRNFYNFIDEIIIPVDISKNLNKIKSIDIISYNNLSINIEDIIIFDKKINYNYKDKNPVDYVYFYDTNNINTKYKMNKNHISLLLPDIFEERIIRIYSKINNNDINKKIKKSFRQFMNKIIN